MKLLSPIIDKVQAMLPPNRIVILLTPYVFVPTSALVSGWLAQHAPGLDLPQGAILGLMGAAALAAITLWYKWLDHWQAQEPIDVDGDLELALSEFLSDPDARHAFAQLHPDIFAELALKLGHTTNLNPIVDVGNAIAKVRTEIDGGPLMKEPTLAARALQGIEETLHEFLARQDVAPDSSTSA